MVAIQSARQLNWSSSPAPKTVLSTRSAVVETGDGALKTEHKVVGLPVVAHLAAAKNARSALAETLRRDEVAEPVVFAVFTHCWFVVDAADMAADIEAAQLKTARTAGALV